MIRIFLSALLLICIGCNSQSETQICQPGDCSDMSIEVGDSLDDMVFKDGKFISPRQRQAVAGD